MVDSETLLGELVLVSQGGVGLVLGLGDELWVVLREESVIVENEDLG